MVCFYDDYFDLLDIVSQSQHAYCLTFELDNEFEFGLYRVDTCSGVARVPCTLGQEIFLRPLSTKTTEFEMKNSPKNLEDAKFVLF